jgi:hypothetical protein
MAKDKEMTDTQKTRLFVNVPFNTAEDMKLREQLEIMVQEHGGTNTAAFIRLLISQEWDRRQQVKRTIKRMKDKNVWPTT